MVHSKQAETEAQKDVSFPLGKRSQNVLFSAVESSSVN